MPIESYVVCPHCGRIMRLEIPGSKVYCMPCLEVKYAAIRAEWRARGWRG